MIILPERGALRSKFLQPIADREWRPPSQAQEKNCFGHENQTRFRVRALTHDGVPRWIGIFDDRADFDAFMLAIAGDTLKWDRALWDLPNETWMPGYGWGNVGWRPDLGEGLLYDFVTTSFITSGTSWSVPADCSGVSGQSGEFIDTIGAGGSGAYRFTGNTNGGGGGAWSRITTLSLTPSGSVDIGVGAGGSGGSGTSGSRAGVAGGDTWFNNAVFASASVGAKGGGGGTSAATFSNAAAVSGGAAASRPNSGSTSGNSGGGVAVQTGTFVTNRGSGGGGAAGPNGNGNAATTVTGSSGQGTNGGSGDAGSGGSVGSGVSNTAGGTGGTGGNGAEYDASHGSGGGGGGAGNHTTVGNSTGGYPGAYGAGSGATGNTGGGGTATVRGGGAGLIVVSYVPVLKAMPPFRRSPRFFTRSF